MRKYIKFLFTLEPLFEWHTRHTENTYLHISSEENKSVYVFVRKREPSSTHAKENYEANNRVNWKTKSWTIFVGAIVSLVMLYDDQQFPWARAQRTLTRHNWTGHKFFVENNRRNFTSHATLLCAFCCCCCCLLQQHPSRHRVVCHKLRKYSTFFFLPSSTLSSYSSYSYDLRAIIRANGTNAVVKYLFDKIK